MSDTNEQTELENEDFNDAFDEFSESEEPSDVAEQDHTEDPAQDDTEAISEADKYKAEAQQWQHRYNSDMGRQAALQRKIQELEQQIQHKPAANPDNSGMSDDEWTALADDFPEIASAVEKRIVGMSSKYENQIAQLQGQMAPIQEQAKSNYIKSQFQILEQDHPDWNEIAVSAEFADWVTNQPHSVQQLKDSEQAADAAYLLSTYKLHTGQSNKRGNDMANQRQRKLNQARTIPGRTGSKKPTLSEDDFDAAFDHYARQ